eukprot:2421760-Rhodomonas_salina.1
MVSTLDRSSSQQFDPTGLVSTTAQLHCGSASHDTRGLVEGPSGRLCYLTSASRNAFPVVG